MVAPQVRGCPHGNHGKAGRKWVAPQVRGCPGYNLGPYFGLKGCPAGAGMSRKLKPGQFNKARLPRRCGDVPPA